MEIIDAHVHALPRGEMCGGKVDARLETVLAALQSRGIERAILVPINDISWQPVEEMNDFSERVVAEHPEIVGFVDLDLSRAHYYRGIRDLEQEVVRRHEHGLRGIKVHPQNLGLNADDWRLLAVYRLAGEIGIPVMIHCYPASGPGTLDNSHPRSIEKAVRVFHRTTFIIAHLGGIPYFPYMPWLSQENVYFDNSGVMKELLGYFGLERVRYVLEEISYDRILFGSDMPSEAMLERQLEMTRQVIPPEKQPQVFAGNVKRLGEQFGWWEGE